MAMPRLFNRIRAGLTAIAAFGAGTAALAAGPLTDIPADKAADREQLWAAVMESFYGGHDAARECWLATIDLQEHCMRPHRLDAVDADTGHLYFIVTGGYRISEIGEPDNCHACAGSLGLIVLRQSGSLLELVARNGLAAQAGAWGAIPDNGSFRLREIGDGAYGWTMERLWGGQGYVGSTVSVFGVSGSDVVDLGDVPILADNTDLCGNETSTCFTKTYDLVFDALSGDGFRDIVLKKRPDSTEGPASFRIPFDREGFAYTLPPVISEFFSF
jgi:hypothetical protein